MLQISNLKEKELLIAHYFCGLKKKELTPYEVFDMWSNWFKRDFRINGVPVFTISDDRLTYRKDSKVTDRDILNQYNQTFQNIYKWIKHTLEVESHDKIYFKQELEKERNKEYGRVIRTAKPLGIYIAMNTSYSRLAEFKLMEYGKKRYTITSGDCDKMIAYLEKIKEKSECNSNN